MELRRFESDEDADRFLNEMMDDVESVEIFATPKSINGRSYQAQLILVGGKNRLVESQQLEELLNSGVLTRMGVQVKVA